MTPRSSFDSDSPTPMKRKSCARKCERACCSVVTYFPLAFVYGLTTWAAWVLADMGLRSDTRSISNTTASAFGILLYLLLNWSYTTAVFTPPGSPTSSGTGYSSLPTHETSSATSFTVKSTGETRFCKKCQARKPDRTHHCSTCNQCVLKMDHHCPWLATCVGLRNYKAFILFLIYTTIFCWVCFGNTTKWLWSEVFSDAQYTESLMPVNYILLCVIAGIIGLVLTGFTGWHLSLAARGMTTIECLEKTRYLSPLRKTMQKQQRYRDINGNIEGEQRYGQQLAEIHANVLPGVTRPEEGEAMLASDDLELVASRDIDGDRSRGVGTHGNYASLERSRERARYEDYLDEQNSEKLPNAFDLGWRRNIRHLLGPQPFLWGLPICNTTGDGWRWEPNPRWVEARENIRRERELEREEGESRVGYPHGHGEHLNSIRGNDGRHYLPTSNGVVDAPTTGLRNPGKAHHAVGRPAGGYFDRDSSDADPGRPGSRMSLKTLRRKISFDGDEHYEVSSDEYDEDNEGPEDERPRGRGSGTDGDGQGSRKRE